MKAISSPTIKQPLLPLVYEAPSGICIMISSSCGTVTGD
jgi:hypothetical protein